MNGFHVAYYAGVQQPGVIRVFDPNGEVVVQSCFARIEYQPADFEGGIGYEEVGNRGTKHGLNRCSDNTLPLCRFCKN